LSVALVKPTAIAKHEGIEQVEAAMLNLPQADCPLVHRFGPGLYIRELTIPPGAFVVAHKQRTRHLNIVLSGKFIMEGPDGSLQELSAPMFFVAEPGRKIGYTLTTVVWQNIYATEETDIDKLEEMFLDKSETWVEYQKQESVFLSNLREPDRKDYNLFLSEFATNLNANKSIFENEDGQISMPEEWAGATSVRISDIEGRGLFLAWPVPKNTIISPVRFNGKCTPAGKYVNHSANPNCICIKTENNDIYLVANFDIQGCQGGNRGEELTIDYRQALSLAQIGE